SFQVPGVELVAKPVPQTAGRPLLDVDHTFKPKLGLGSGPPLLSIRLHVYDDEADVAHLLKQAPNVEGSLLSAVGRLSRPVRHDVQDPTVTHRHARPWPLLVASRVVCGHLIIDRAHPASEFGNAAEHWIDSRICEPS